MAWTQKSREKALATKKLNGSQNQYSKAKALGNPIPKMSEESREKLRKHGTNRTHTQETKEKLSVIGLNSKHRRLVKSVRDYTKLDGTVVQLDSSWEEALAKRLDSLNVSWIRPEPFKWIDKTGKARNYFPDFYLPEYNLFLDPKNPAAMQQQNEKVCWLRTNIPNIVFLESLEQINDYVPIV